MKNESPVSPLSALLSILTKSINTLEGAYSEANLQYPSLDAPFAPTPLDGNAELIQATRHAVAAAAQIIATIRVPIETVQEYSTSSYAAASLNLVVETNVANILKLKAYKILSILKLVLIKDYLLFWPKLSLIIHRLLDTKKKSHIL